MEGLKKRHCDFYYSRKHEKYAEEVNEWIGATTSKATVNGICYTEMITHNKKPLTSNFDDLILVHSSDDYEIKVEFV